MSSEFSSDIVFFNSVPTTNDFDSSPSSAVDELLLKSVLKYAPSLVVAKSFSSTPKLSNVSSSTKFIFVAFATVF